MPAGRVDHQTVSTNRIDLCGVRLVGNLSVEPWTVTGGSGSMAHMSTWTIRAEPVIGADVDEVMREYFTEMGRRVLGRPGTDAELRAVLVEDPHHVLSPPDGEFLVARSGEGELLGCAGLRLLRGTPETAELKRMYVRPAGRGASLGRGLLLAVEQSAKSSSS